MSLPSEIKIHFKQLRFFAYHGLYDAEKANGNEFELDASLCFPHPGKIIEHISDTVNYAEVYEIIQRQMQNPRELLETFLEELAADIKERFPKLSTINLVLYKLTAPIKGLSGKVGVELSRKYI